MSIVSEIDPGRGPSCCWSNCAKIPGDGPAAPRSDGWDVISTRLRVTVLVMVAVLQVGGLPVQGNFGALRCCVNYLSVCVSAWFLVGFWTLVGATNLLYVSTKR